MADYNNNNIIHNKSNKISSWWWKSVNDQKKGIEVYLDLKKRDNEAMLISIDNNSKNGSKRFVVCNYTAFIKTLLKLPMDKRNLYEVCTFIFNNLLLSLFL